MLRAFDLVLILTRSIVLPIIIIHESLIRKKVLFNYECLNYELRIALSAIVCGFCGEICLSEVRWKKAEVIFNYECHNYEL